MTITQLHYVLAVAEHQNFTKAARYCHVTQPTLSMQVQKLEDELNVQIFDRGKKPIELTAVGTKIVSQAKNIVAESERINDIVDQDQILPPTSRSSCCIEDRILFIAFFHNSNKIYK